MAGESSLIKALLENLRRARPEALQRAKSLGFNIETPYYHATKYDFNEFVPSKWRGASYFADTPEGAMRGWGAGGSEHPALEGPTGSGKLAGPNIMPVFIKGRTWGKDPMPEEWFPKHISYKDWKDIVEGRNKLHVEGLTPEELSVLNWKRSEGFNTSYENGRQFDTYVPNLSEHEYRNFPREKELEMPLIRARVPIPESHGWEGLEGSEGKKYREFYSKTGYPNWVVNDEAGRSIAVSDPRNIRSVFSEFNPEHSESADLMKSHGGSAKSPAWTRKEGKNPEGGLNEKGRASLRAAGHDIKRPQPEGGARKDSFCARMKGMKAKLTSSETANDPDSRINKSLRKWNCHADGGAIDIARQYRETGGKTDSEAYRKAMEDAIKRRQEKALRGDDEDILPNDPRRYVTPYEYRRGNLGFGTYALANGGRALLADGGDPTQAYVQSLYQNVMGRPGEQGGVDYWTNQLKSGDVTQPEVLQSFAQSNEFKNLYNTDPAKAVSALYQTALGRAPEQSGLDYWTGQAKSGLDLGKMVSGFTGSQEGQNVQSINQLYQNWLENMPSQQQLQWAKSKLAGGEKLGQLEEDISRSPEVLDYNNRAWLSGLYQDVLGRAPDKEGLDYWAEQLNSGKTSWSDVAGALQGTEEAKNYDAQNAVPYQVAGPSVKASVTYPTYRELDPESVQNVISGMSGKDIPNVARYIQDAPDFKYDNARLAALPMTQKLANKYLGTPDQAKNIDWSNSVAFVRALEQAGIPQQAAMAIAGNAGVESALGQYGTQKWDVKEAGGKGPGVGTLQFTYPSRKKDFQRIAQDYGGTNTLAGNVAAIANEMKNPEYAKIIKAAANAPDLKTASDIIARYYENPQRSALYETAPMRAAMAQQILPQYQAYAAKYPYSPPPLPPKIVDVALPPNRPDQTVLDKLAQSGAGGNVGPFVSSGTAQPNGNPLPGASVVSTIPGSGVPQWQPQNTGMMPADAQTIFQQMQNNAYMNYIGQNLNNQSAVGSGAAGGFASGNTGGVSSGPSGFAVSFGPGFSHGGAVDIARSYRKAGGPVWDKPRPKGLGKPDKLSPSEKSSAKAAAKAAGRPYPNLVDNMRAAREEGGRLRPLIEAKIEEIGDTELGKYGIGPKAPASTKDELKAGPEQSTWESIAAKAMGDRPSPERRRFVEGAGNIADVAHLGSYATPLAPYVGAADFARGVASGDPMEAALGATGLPGKGAKAVGTAMSAMMPESAEAGPLAKALNAIRAYHGSPHWFDKFDISKIGTGEGAQAYGHGLYFADREGVARSYRDAVSNMQEVTPHLKFEGSTIYRGHDLNDLTPAQIAAQSVAELGGIDQSRRTMLDFSKSPYTGKMWSDALAELEANPQRFKDVGWQKPGYMYEVDIHADPSHMLDWDKPLRDHPEYVRSKMNQLGVGDVITREAPRSLFAKPGSTAPSTSFPTTGRLAYQEAGNTQPEATEVLNKLGIPGIKYLDQGSRTAGEGTSNYVVFDPNIIEILRRYKEGGRVEAAGGGGILKAAKDALLALHNMKSHRLDMVEKLGGLPVPSIAVGKPEHGFRGFGDITLVGGKEMATPSRLNPVFASDVYSPRFPYIEEDSGKIFRGFTPSGYRRYAPVTMENVVREMKGNIRGGENYNYGAGSVRAAVTPQFKTLKGVQDARGKIIPEAEFKPHKEAANAELFTLADKFHPYSRYSNSSFGHANTFSETLSDIGRGKHSAWGQDYENLPDELKSEAMQYLTRLRNMPTEYFEAKPQRAVELGEFSGAVVPENIMKDVEPRLRNLGVREIVPFKPEEEGGQQKALREFSGLHFNKGGRAKKPAKV